MADEPVLGHPLFSCSVVVFSHGKKTQRRVEPNAGVVFVCRHYLPTDGSGVSGGSCSQLQPRLHGDRTENGVALFPSVALDRSPDGDDGVALGLDGHSHEGSGKEVLRPALLLLGLPTAPEGDGVCFHFMPD